MHIPAMLVLLHGPEEQRLSATCLFPSLSNVLLLLLVLNQMLVFVLGEYDAPVDKLGEEIGVKRSGGRWQPEHPDHVAHPSLHLRVHLDCPRALLFPPVVKLSDKAFAAGTSSNPNTAWLPGQLSTRPPSEYDHPARGVVEFCRGALNFSGANGNYLLSLLVVGENQC